MYSVDGSKVRMSLLGRRFSIHHPISRLVEDVPRQVMLSLDMQYIVASSSASRSMEMMPCMDPRPYGDCKGLELRRDRNEVDVWEIEVSRVG